VISVADAYDAMTARGSYKAPRSVSEAVDELSRVAGSQLDAAFVEAFVELLGSHAATSRRVLAQPVRLPARHRVAPTANAVMVPARAEPPHPAAGGGTEEVGRIPR
jgi:HD-GYP domain-containing protein (c-di-GMP phosphodiesterase class II)